MTPFESWLNIVLLATLAGCLAVIFTALTLPKQGEEEENDG